MSDILLYHNKGCAQVDLLSITDIFGRQSRLYKGYKEVKHEQGIERREISSLNSTLLGGGKHCRTMLAQSPAEILLNFQ